MNLGDHIVQEMYQGYGETVVWAAQSPALCASVANPQRHAWCLESGFSINASGAAVPGVTLSSPFNVTGMFNVMWCDVM